MDWKNSVRNTHRQLFLKMPLAREVAFTPVGHSVHLTVDGNMGFMPLFPR